MPELALADGAALHYQVDDFTEPWGRAEPALLVHGNAERGDAWFAWVPHLARRLRVVRPDLRGFGRSQPMPEDFPWTIDVLVRDLAHVADRLAVGRFHLIGAKFGGTVALRFAAEHPELVRTLTVLGAPPAPRASLAATVPSWVAHMREHGVRSWARWTMAGRLGSAMPPEAVDYWAELMGATPLSTQLGFMRMVPEVDVSEGLPRIACPTLVITTTGSGLGSVEEVTAWQRRIPRSELLVMSGDSYHVAASDADACAAATLAFIERHRGG